MGRIRQESKVVEGDLRKKEETGLAFVMTGSGQGYQLRPLLAKVHVFIFAVAA